jgi:hypothetical protein
MCFDTMATWQSACQSFRHRSCCLEAPCRWRPPDCGRDHRRQAGCAAAAAGPAAACAAAGVLVPRLIQTCSPATLQPAAPPRAGQMPADIPQWAQGHAELTCICHSDEMRCALVNSGMSRRVLLVCFMMDSTPPAAPGRQHWQRLLRGAAHCRHSRQQTACPSGAPAAQRLDLRHHAARHQTHGVSGAPSNQPSAQLGENSYLKGMSGC